MLNNPQTVYGSVTAEMAQDEMIEFLWDDFQSELLDNENPVLQNDIHIWAAGTSKETIKAWFNINFSRDISSLLSRDVD